MPMQVTATEGGPTGNGILLRVRVLTGYAAVPAGNTGSYSSGSGPAAASVTTTVTGSMVYGALALGVETAWTARAGTTITDDHDDTTQFDRYATCQSTAVTGTPGATIFGTTAPTAGSGFYAAAFAEILPDGTIFEDPSGPALAQTDSATTVTTDAFSPPAGTLLLAQVSSNGGSISVTTMSVSGGGLNWTELAFGNTHPGMYAGVWIAVVGPTPGDDPPITATQGGSTGPGMVARIKVLTGAAPAASQTGATATQTGTAAHQASITTTTAGSIVYGGLADGTNTTMTAASGTTLLDNFQDSTHGCYYGTCRTTAATGTPGAVTVGASAPSSVGGAALAEILPATPGGTIVEDLSSPAAVTTTTLITVTVNVTPPAGSMLVLMLGCDSGSGTETMTVSGGGLTWIAKAQAASAGQMYAGVWIADFVAPSIARDTETAGVNYTSTGTQTTSHAAAAGARAAVVMIDQNGTTADEVSGVTYGGAAMTRLRSDTEATEAGRTYIYWLDNIAGGTQNVAMTTTAATSKQLVAATMITGGGGPVAVAGHNTGTSASVANPSWTITGLTAGTLLEAYEVIHSGLTTMTATPAAGWTLITSTDLGAAGRGFARQEVAVAGTTLASGWTAATADDFVGSSVAFYAVPAAIPPDLMMAPRIPA